MVKKTAITPTKQHSNLSSLILGLGLGFFSLFFILIITSILTFSWLFYRWWPVVNQVRQAADLSWSNVFQLASQVKQTSPRQTNLTWLILGIDQLAERGENQPIFTDTIMLVSINPTNQSVTMLSVPRDVWLPDQALKINTIYQSNLTKYLNQNQQLLTDKQISQAQQNKIDQEVRQQTLLDFSQVFGLPIDQLLILDMKLVPELIDALGGVEVNVETAFTDYAYPRSDVDVTTERDPRKLYETVSFESGPIKLDGDTALKYMRSRKAQNSEGNDLARAKRQQQVISALINQLLGSFPPQSVEEVIEYLDLYQASLATQVPLSELIKVIYSLPGSPLNYSLKPTALPVIPIDNNGILFESPRHYSGQWVFEMTSLEDFQVAIREQIE